MSSLYERLGGEAAIMAAVDIFYQKVLDDDLTRPFFDDVDMGAQARKQIAFMSVAFGGPVEYQGRPLREAHAALVRKRGLGDAHFDAVARHLEETLRELDIDAALITEVLQVVESTRSEVLSR